jgi:hypothetical protein
MQLIEINIVDNWDNKSLEVNGIQFGMYCILTKYTAVSHNSLSLTFIYYMWTYIYATFTEL